ncbi:MAG: YCF48-related protein, partial [bacterium]
MPKHRFITVAFVCSTVLISGGATGDLGFEEEPWDEMITVNPRDTVYAVAIYACAVDSLNDSLPSWWDAVWDTTSGENSIPNYYKDVSFGKHRLFPDAFGRDSAFCFVAYSYSGIVVGDSGVAIVTNDLDTCSAHATGTSKHLHSVSFRAGYTGAAVGDSGTIIQTIDGGKTWTPRSSGIATDLRGVYMWYSTGIAVGDSGTILRTLDWGETWNTVSSPTSNHLYDISLCHPIVESYAAVGDSGKVLWTYNNGTDWYTVSPLTTKRLYAISLRQLAGFAVGESGLIFRTTNCGGRWDTLSSGTTNDLRGVHSPATDTAFVVGDLGTILRTRDSGDTWDSLQSGTTSDLRDVYFADTETGIVVGTSGAIFLTTDAGDSWDTLSSGTTNDLQSVYLKRPVTGGHGFNWDVLTKADSVIDFADYDGDADSVVDMVFMMVPRFSGKSVASLYIEMPYFPTNDVSGSGDTIFVYSGNGTRNLIVSPSKAVGVPVHEYGHKLGLRDYYGFDLPVNGYALGSFEPMAAGGFYGRVSPFNPWFRSRYGVGFDWLTPTQVSNTLMNEPIQDISTGEVYELVCDFASEDDMKGQSFFVSNHQKVSFWEEFWPARGLMVWHVFDNQRASFTDSRRKVVDLETPHGLWDWDFDPDTITSNNPVGGLDSLDVSAAADTWKTLHGGLGSPTCIYRANVDTTLDAFSNPSSDEYNSGGPVPLQNIASHVAVRNIHRDTGDTSVMKADLIVNRVESDVGTATGKNSGKRWILGVDGDTMHLAYASKGYIYYTRTDSNKVWQPAVPVGEGSFPCLSLDTSGNPALVWMKQGICDSSNAKLLFSTKGSGGWTTPDTLLS